MKEGPCWLAGAKQHALGYFHRLGRYLAALDHPQLDLWRFCTGAFAVRRDRFCVPGAHSARHPSVAVPRNPGTHLGRSATILPKLRVRDASRED